MFEFFKNVNFCSWFIVGIKVNPCYDSCQGLLTLQVLRVFFAILTSSEDISFVCVLSLEQFVIGFTNKNLCEFARVPLCIFIAKLVRNLLFFSVEIWVALWVLQVVYSPRISCYLFWIIIEPFYDQHRYKNKAKTLNKYSISILLFEFN